MTQRKSGEFSARRERKSDFPRPDAEQARKGAPEHEQKPGDDAESAEQNDDAHGYTQDSGYRGSGGYSDEEESRGKTPIVRTQKPGNGHTHSDEQIRSHIQQRLAKERAPRASHLLVSVGQGIVTLSGEVDDEAERRRLTDLVRDVASVRELHDELSTRAGHHDVN
jgi:hypothetical protein